jgi:hypothetical protein
VSQPLALVLYEKLTPGSQLVNRLQDMHYRVHPFNDPAQLVSISVEEKPLVIFADSDVTGGDVMGEIVSLRRNPSTAHIPVIVFADTLTDGLNEQLKNTGVTLVVTDTAILTHLSQLLEQVLRVE